MTLDTRIADAAARVFKVDPAEVGANLKIGDVSGWDSLGQLSLIIEIEAVFGARFDGDQLISLNSLAEIQRELTRRHLLVN
jgi:acyl carrier protein